MAIRQRNQRQSLRVGFPAFAAMHQGEIQMANRLIFLWLLGLAFFSPQGPSSHARAAEFESSIERIESIGDRKFLSGFAFRRSTPNPARLQVYLDNPPGRRGKLVATVIANLRRDDVKAVLGSPMPLTGFRWEIPQNLENSGRRVYVCLEGTRELLRSPIAERDGSIVLADTTQPMGVLERVATVDHLQVAQGWAWFPSVVGESIRVDLYVDNLPAAGGEYAGSAKIAGERPDLTDKLGLPHTRLGFAIPLPDRILSSGRKLHAIAVAPNGNGIVLKSGIPGGREPVSVPFDLSVAENIQPARLLSWSPGIESPRRVRALSQAPWIQANTLEDESAGNSAGPGFWLISTSMETARFAPVRPGGFMDALLPGDPIFRTSAYSANSGRYAMRLKLDNTSGRTIDGIATSQANVFGGVNDSYDLNPPQGLKPSVGENVFVELEYRVIDRRTWNIVGIDPSRARFFVGATTRFPYSTAEFDTVITNYTEVNLDRTATADLCPTRGLANANLTMPPGVARNASDPAGKFDMRHYWESNQLNPANPDGGELVFYDRQTIRGLIAEGRTPDGWVRLKIPMSYLIASYDWARKPKSWDDVEIGGIYFGIEVWAKGVMDIEVREYRAWSAGNYSIMQI